MLKLQLSVKDGKESAAQEVPPMTTWILHSQEKMDWPDFVSKRAAKMGAGQLADMGLGEKKLQRQSSFKIFTECGPSLLLCGRE